MAVVDEKLAETQDIQTDYSPPTVQDQRWLFDYKQFYWTVKAGLYGGWLVENKQGNYVIKKPLTARSLMNEKGIETTMSVVNAFVSPINATSRFSQERIYELCKVLNDALVDLYHVNMDAFELTEEMASIVIRFIMNTIEGNMNKSINATTLLGIFGTEHVNINRNEPGGQPQRNFLGVKF